MTLYRVISRTPLSTGHKQGDIIKEGELKHIAKLLAAGRVAEVASPPLSELPGWANKAKLLEPTGILTVQELIECDEAAVSERLGYKTTSTVRRWKREVERWLSPPRDD